METYEKKVSRIIIAFFSFLNSIKTKFLKRLKNHFNYIFTKKNLQKKSNI